MYVAYKRTKYKKKRDDDICQMSKAKSFVTGPNIRSSLS